MATFFVAGTDTAVGKTCVTRCLLKAAASQGLRSLGLKPVAAGTDVAVQDSNNETHSLENEDVVALAEAASVSLSLRHINPVCLPEPLSPHIAADRAGVTVTIANIHAAMQVGLNAESDLTLVEGAGGWRVPINERETMADLARALNVPVILVVGMRLGCLNHALLTAEAIRRDGLELHGWIANELSADMPAIEENVATLNRHMFAPMLARVPYRKDIDTEFACSSMDISKVLS